MQSTKNGVREIAKLAKVSIGTVSNVLNRPEVVSPETVERVNAAIKELGYQVGARKQGRRRIVLCDTPESEALIDKAIAEGVAIEKICICEESKREKALIALAVAHAQKCPYCIDAYTTQCLETGSNPEQMMEAVHVAAVMQAGITLVHSVQMQNHLKKMVL